MASTVLDALAAGTMQLLTGTVRDMLCEPSWTLHGTATNSWLQATVRRSECREVSVALTCFL
jgi:hypothetical protein